jgi:phage repressor protein C with HTH and peptisase S24 domain
MSCILEKKSEHPAARLIRDLLSDKGITQSDLALKIGITQSQISKRLKSGMKRGVRREFAEAFGMTINEFDDLWRSKAVPQLQGDPSGGIPILGAIPAGNGEGTQWAYDQGIGEGYVSRGAVGVEDPLAYAVRVTGDSMAPELMDGELVICSPTAVQENGFEEGRIYAIRFGADLNHDATIKRVHLISTASQEIELVPENPRHPRIKVKTQQIDRAARVVGKYVRYD